KKNLKLEGSTLLDIDIDDRRRLNGCVRSPTCLGLKVAGSTIRVFFGEASQSIGASPSLK
ncbi:MAG TPA: hypothetical protein DCF96_02905, partial [Rhodobacteraceae bacterium]|nr:hypothetical protein [Paracoccaceae bacterium]